MRQADIYVFKKKSLFMDQFNIQIFKETVLLVFI